MWRTVARLVATLSAMALVVGCVVVSPSNGGWEARTGRPPGARGAVFAPAQREAVHVYWRDHGRRRGCPPGLAKKHNGCLPPGQAKKRYAIGHRLPRGVVIVELPPELEIRIGRPPRGYAYGVVDGDVVKVAVGTLLVVDAITN